MPQKVILVVDMLRRVPRGVKALLKAHGFHVTTSRDTRAPDAALIWVRPTVSAAVEAIRELRATGGLPILVLGETESEYEIELLLAAGADEYVPDPYAASMILALLERRLKLGGDFARP